MVESQNEIKIEYDLKIRTRDDAARIAKAVAKFYKGKKILGVKVPAFRRLDSRGNPGNDWEAKVCKGPGKSLYININAQYQMMGMSVTVSDTCPKSRDESE